MSNVDALIWGFFLGILASAIAWLISEKWAQAKPVVRLDSQRFMGQTPEGAHEFFHVVVRNARTWWPISVRRPAWACEARVTVVEPVDTLGASPTVIARWSSQPEPVSPTDHGLALDPGKMILGRRMDVYSHHDERIGLLLKHEGDPNCYLFSNESYHFPGWRNPAWRLPEGRYRLRVTVLHESGEVTKDLRLKNAGSSRNDVRITPWN